MVKPMLSLFVDKNQDDWDKHIPYVMIPYRYSQHNSMKLTPNMLMLVREVALLLDLMVGQLEEQTGVAVND